MLNFSTIPYIDQFFLFFYAELETRLRQNLTQRKSPQMESEQRKIGQFEEQRHFRKYHKCPLTRVIFPFMYAIHFKVTCSNPTSIINFSIFDPHVNNLNLHSRRIFLQHNWMAIWLLTRTLPATCLHLICVHHSHVPCSSHTRCKNKFELFDPQMLV